MTDNQQTTEQQSLEGAPEHGVGIPARPRAEAPAVLNVGQSQTTFKDLFLFSLERALLICAFVSLIMGSNHSTTAALWANACYIRMVRKLP